MNSEWVEIALIEINSVNGGGKVAIKPLCFSVCASVRLMCGKIRKIECKRCSGKASHREGNPKGASNTSALGAHSKAHLRSEA